MRGFLLRPNRAHDFSLILLQYVQAVGLGYGIAPLWGLADKGKSKRKALESKPRGPQMEMKYTGMGANANRAAHHA